MSLHACTVVGMEDSESVYTPWDARGKLRRMTDNPPPHMPQHNVRVPDEVWQRWMRLAREENQSISEVVRAELSRWERRVLRRRREEQERGREQD